MQVIISTTGQSLLLQNS